MSYTFDYRVDSKVSEIDLKMSDGQLLHNLQWWWCHNIGHSHMIPYVHLVYIPGGNCTLLIVLLDFMYAIYV